MKLQNNEQNCDNQDLNKSNDHGIPIDIKPEYDFGKFELISREDIQADEYRILKLNSTEDEIAGLFILKTASQWLEQAKAQPIPKMLFSEFWHQGELCILFADTNLGKSILAVQIGNSISSGVRISGFKLEAPKQTVLYFDFELSLKQFEARYSENFVNHYSFDENFMRVELDPDMVVPSDQSFEDYLSLSLEISINKSGAKVLIIDNLTYLKTETERAKDALPLMKHLKALKSKYNLSILALAHTPKRDLTKPITRNDLQGSKMLINFCDSSFTIGESTLDKHLRYLKQIKQRHTEHIYDSENVCICQIEKPYNFLQFDFVDFGKEWDHLKQYSEQDEDGQTEKIIELNKRGLSLRDIGKELGISHSTVGRILKTKGSA